jgi:membrane fusion protein, copper/silver efflux system
MNSNMTKTFLIVAVAAALVSGAFLLGRSSGSDRDSHDAAAPKVLYTCGMHREVVQDHPGNCPICGMKLTPILSQAGTSGTAESQAIAVDATTRQNMDIRTATVTRGPLRRTIRAVGTVDYNETALTEVTTKFKGWIEKLVVNATGQLVKHADPLFEIYSPELYGAQEEYVLALGTATNASPSAEALRNSARTKLKFFDISDEQIAELECTRQPRKALSIRAPQDGFVVEKTVVEGQMVEAGARIFRLADLGLVWVQAQIYEQDLAYIKPGQEATVTLSYLPDRVFRGHVTYLYPDVDEKTRAAKVRMEFKNPGYLLKPGMFATVQITSELEPSALLVPDMAVLRSGEKNTVFVALAGGKFEPRTVTLGPQGENDTYQALDGLKEGERIVTSGQFLLDSESQLRAAVQKMSKPPQPDTAMTTPPPAEHPAVDHQP